MSAKIDEIAKKIAAFLPVDASINILNPVIAANDFPTNLCAIKLLLELVGSQSDQISDVHIDSVMPNIARVSFAIVHSSSLIFLNFKSIPFIDCLRFYLMDMVSLIIAENR